uniref:hypothetical protein n=1 Tax=Salmonella sp. TaxID=599 RepID=UPI001CD9A450|nr:hypothetical protein [Salmonella sp.]
MKMTPAAERVYDALSESDTDMMETAIAISVTPLLVVIAQCWKRYVKVVRDGYHHP